MSDFRRNLLLSGLGGLLGNALLTALAAWLVASETLSVLLPYPTVALLLGVVFGGFSLAEIPVMVFALRRLLVERRGNRGFVLGLNVLYVFFAAVYAAPALLLTGSLGWGLALSSLSLLRFATSLLFLQAPREPPEASQEAEDV